MISLCESIYEESKKNLIVSFSFQFQMISRKGMTISNSKKNFLIIQINPAHKNYFRKKTEDLRDNKKWDGEDINILRANTLKKDNDLIDSLL